MVGRGKDQGGSSGRPCHVNPDGSRKNRHRERPRGHTRGRPIAADARTETAHDGRKKYKAGERLVSAAVEGTTLHGVSAEDGHHSDGEEEDGTKAHKKRVIPEAVKSAIETVKKNILVHP